MPRAEQSAEVRSRIAQKMRENWKNPAKRAAWMQAMRVKKRERRDDTLSDETLAQFLREYVERDPRGDRIFRFTIAELGRRYLLSEHYVLHLAAKHGVKRPEKMKKLSPAKVKQMVSRYVVLGHSVLALSMSYSVSMTAVRYRLRKEGIDASMRGIGVHPERIAA